MPAMRADEPPPIPPAFVRNAEQVALSSHILTVSATLVGVCLTVIGLIRVIERLQQIRTIEDELLAVNSLIFLAATTLAYLALRTRSARSYQRLERSADACFLCGLAFMCVICCLIAYEVV